MTENKKLDPWELLREVQDHFHHHGFHLSGEGFAELRKRVDFALEGSPVVKKLVVELDKDNGLHNEADSAEVWVLRLCDLVGHDGSNEKGRLEAFCLLYDAVKAAKRLR
jgi:hypothetical protein